MPEDVKQAPTFEERLDELERIVKALEKGDLPLEQSLNLFESGMHLGSECKRELDEAETRVEILLKKGTEITPVPFTPGKPTK
jgi:exodeoxyribonuclease VII small subunit